MDDLYGSNTPKEVEESDVYVNTEGILAPGDEVSAQKFNFILGLTLFWGFAVNYILFIFLDIESIIAKFPLFIPICFFGYVISCLIGQVVYTTSKNPVISFIGYNLVVLPLGVVLAVFLSTFELATGGTAIIKEGIAITGVITLIMMILGTAFPTIFNKIIKAVTVVMLVTLVVELIASLFGASFSLYNFIIIGGLCVYIGYDWGRANTQPKTIDNAIDGAAALYMDIIALLMRILMLLAKSRSRD